MEGNRCALGCFVFFSFFKVKLHIFIRTFFGLTVIQTLCQPSVIVIFFCGASEKSTQFGDTDKLCIALFNSLNLIKICSIIARESVHKMCTRNKKKIRQNSPLKLVAQRYSLEERRFIASQKNHFKKNRYRAGVCGRLQLKGGGTFCRFKLAVWEAQFELKIVLNLKRHKRGNIIMKHPVCENNPTKSCNFPTATPFKFYNPKHVREQLQKQLQLSNSSP